VVRILCINANLFMCCIGRHNKMTTMWFENPVRVVAHGGGVGSQKNQLLAQSRHCRQTQSLTT